MSYGPFDCWTVYENCCLRDIRYCLSCHFFGCLNGFTLGWLKIVILVSLALRQHFVVIPDKDDDGQLLRGLESPED
jgi:hypothetical protein